MQTTARLRRGLKLRPRAGRIATYLFLGGLAVSAASAVAIGGLEPAEAQSSQSVAR